MKASLHIQIGVSEDRTFLRSAFCTTPFKVANITENKKTHLIELMIMSSSPGILDGDHYQLKIDLDAGATLKLHTQSYQRLFNMKAAASLSMRVNMQTGSSFCFIPHPTVPHKSSSFTASNRINLSGNCTLLLGEILTCGRKLNGEIFSFSKYHSVTEIFLHGKLVIKENLLVIPSATNLNAIGQWENYTHQASLVYLDENAPVTEHIKTIQEILSPHNEIIFGISQAPVNGLVIRILGQKAEQLFGCLKTVSELLTKSKKLQTIL